MMNERSDYMARVFTAFGQGLFHGTEGRVVENIVQHDDACPMLQGQGVCACDPDITIVWIDDQGVEHSVEIP